MPQTPDALAVEVQYLDGDHALHRMGLHGHTFFELLFLEYGAGAHRVGAEWHPTQDGELFVIPPGALHDCTNLGVGARGWVLLFTQDALDGAAATSRAYAPHWPSRHPLLSPFQTIQHRQLTPVSVPSADRGRWSDRFKAMACESNARQPGYRFALQAHLVLVLLDMLRLVGPAADLDHAQAIDPLLRAAFDFIERDYARPISAQDVARAVNRNPAHLTTAMRLRTGLTAGEWITERRMAEARRLLVMTELSLDDIADRAGYSGPDALARAFRRAHRLSPAAWRQAHRGQPPYV